MLPDFGWTELLVIAIVLIVVVGPKDLPRVIRGFSKSLGSMRKMAGDFRKQFDEALSEAELDDLKTLASDVKGMDPRNSIKDALNPLSKVGQDINDELKGVAKSIDDAGKSESDAEKPADRKISAQEAYPQLSKTPDDLKVASVDKKKAPTSKKSPSRKPAAKKAAATKSRAVAKPKAATVRKPVAAKAPAKRKAAVKKPSAKAESKA